MEALLLVAEHDGPTQFARIGGSESWRGINAPTSENCRSYDPQWRRVERGLVGPDSEQRQQGTLWPPRMPRSTALICPSGCLLSSHISDFPKNISVPTYPKSILELSPSRPTTGAYRDRHGRGMGCGGRGSVLRATGLQGELKDL
jgi:hypothetical protein